MNDGDAPQGLGHLADHGRVWVVVGLHVAPLEHARHQAGELHGVGGQDGLVIALDDARAVDQVPQAVGVDDQRQIGRLDLQKKREILYLFCGPDMTMRGFLLKMTACLDTSAKIAFSSLLAHFQIVFKIYPQDPGT